MNSESYYFLLPFFFKIVLAVLDPLNFHVILGSSHPFLQDSKEFDRDCIESVEQFMEYCHINNIKSSDPWARDCLYLFKQLFCSFQYTSLALLLLN